MVGLSRLAVRKSVLYINMSLQCKNTLFWKAFKKRISLHYMNVFEIEFLVIYYLLGIQEQNTNRKEMKIMFGRKKNKDIKLRLVFSGKEIPYGNVKEGFFEFRGVLFYRAKGGSARLVSNSSKSFTNYIKETYTEYSEIRPSEVSAIMVNPYTVSTK